MKKALALFLANAMSRTLLAGRGQDNTTGETTDTGDTAETSDLVYAVEAGGAGEAVATEKAGSSPLTAQADAPDGSGRRYLRCRHHRPAHGGHHDRRGAPATPDLVYDTEGLTTEEYGIGRRKGSDLAAYINTVLAESYADGSMAEIAATYGIEDALVERPAAEEFTPAESDSDVAYIQDKGAPSSWASPSSSRWTTGTKTASGSASTPTWPSWLLRSWAWRSSSSSSTGTTKLWNWIPRTLTWSGMA